MDAKMQDVFDAFSYGIYVISVKDEGADNAMIASWVSQCSHDPPLLAVAIRKNRLSREQIMKTKAFCIGVLPAGSGGFMKRFKIPEWRKKFEGVESFRTDAGFLMPRRIIGWLDCKIAGIHETGDHTLFIAEACAGGMVKESKPMTTNAYSIRYRGMS